ncbi:MAG: hypothetical protein GY869_21900, partial [Planctomycetes bacterium]|nr:hypothetical protein [Planctomycetota bacterium]
LAAIGSRVVDEGQVLEFTISAIDPDGDDLVYAAANLPTGANFDPATQIFSWTPAYDQSGVYLDVLFAVIDDGTPPFGDYEAITITVNNINRPPILAAIGSRVVAEGQLLEFTISAIDPDGDDLVYAAANLPTGANFDPATQIFSWTPAYDQAGIYPDLEFTVTDDGDPNLSDSETITITVNPFIEQTIDIIPNQFNMISFNVMPENLDIEDIMAGQPCLIIVLDDLGNFYAPQYDINQIGEIQIERGYQVFFNCEESLNISGPALEPANHPITIESTQFNMIGYPKQTASPIATEMASISADIVIVQDHNGNFWAPAYEVNTIDAFGGMQPGMGYRIFIYGDNPISFTYPPNSLLATQKDNPARMKSLAAVGKSRIEKATVVQSRFSANTEFGHLDREPAYFDYIHSGSPYALIVKSVEFKSGPNSTLESGDEIGVFDGDLCVGSLVVPENYSTGMYLPITVWQGDAEYSYCF